MAWSLRAVASMAVAAGVAACGHSSNDAAAAGHSQHQNVKLTHKAGDLVDPDMVTAVSTARSTTPISMKFLLPARPAVGTALTVLVALVPAPDVNISHIHASFQPGEGLQLQSERILDISNPDSGTLIEQQLSVVPQQAGILSLNATVVVDSDGGSMARSYSIPLIVR